MTMTLTRLDFSAGGERVEVMPSPALFRALDEASGGLSALADRIEQGRLRHAELVDLIALLAQGRLHREEVEKAVLEEGAGAFIGLLARVLAVYFTGMKNLAEILSQGEAIAPI